MTILNNIGIFGAGQLGRMLASAAVELGLKVKLYDEAPSPSASVFKEYHQGKFSDKTAINTFAELNDCLSFEFENIPHDVLETINKPIYPPVSSLAASCDRLVEKDLLNKIGIETAPYLAIDCLADTDKACDKLGFPFVMKTRRMGYDGKGQAIVHSQADAKSAFASLTSGGYEHGLIAEGFIAFDYEVSLISAASKIEATRFYQLSRNLHKKGVLHSSYPIADEKLQIAAEAAANKLIKNFDYCGILTIEFFVQGDRLIANEIAPRVHNSGHWTIEGAMTSQFENHLRAIAGLALGSTATRDFPIMINLLGSIGDRQKWLSIPEISLHDYGKEARPGRKVGHLTGVFQSDSDRAAYLMAQS